ncbi:chloramphenicol acetyltransferase [uncultured Bacteroides sp.]|uniref:chloramphenicol acetyltransferase n=1 Tax=uncultured Bacteroides sp. TaxID=162156 RepID=UPI00263191BD|nr:chloramphenicol acetyltransferase [uncultured Bacteroides sp.]
MKHIVDIENWVRKDNYKFFQGFANPWIAMTSEVECTEAYASAKSTGRSFFLYYLYAILRAANEIDEFRYRDDKNGNVVFHDQVDIITPIAVPGKTFYTVRIPYHKDFDTFYAEARRIVTSIPEDGDPYETDKRIAEEGDFDVILLSAIPKLYFTSITYTQYRVGHSMDYPLMNAGKAVKREGKLVMPIALSVSHAFVDGSHIALFFEKVEHYLKASGISPTK